MGLIEVSGLSRSGHTPRLWLFVAALAASSAYAQSQGLVVRDGTLGEGPLAVGPGTETRWGC
jgi:hypothetical protein